MILKHAIVTHYDPKPIPVRFFDWCAYTEDYDPGEQDQEGNWHGGQPIGWGKTEQEAIDELNEKLLDLGEV